ncbi:MAG: MMPL family transporter, partial [Solirubrobacterales bacterium]|nr:MMPL family transporter [Solirubrobacterales bacterium]
MKERIAAVGQRLAELPGGRRAKWAILAVWVIVFMAMGPLAGKFEDAQENDPADYLPAKAESVKAIEELEGFPSGDIADAITVFNRDSGLEPSD